MPLQKAPVIKPLSPKGVFPLKVFDGPGAWVSKLSFSPNGVEIAIASQSGQIEIRNVASGRLRLAIPIDVHHILAATWSPDGRTIASSHSDRFIRLWNARSGENIRTIEAYSAAMANEVSAEHIRRWGPGISQSSFPDSGENASLAIRDLDWSPDGKRLASGSELGLQLWDIATGTMLQEFPRDGTISVKWSPNNRYIATTAYTGNLQIFDALTAELFLRIRSTYTAALAWSPDGRYVASAQDFAIMLWAFPTGELVHVLEGHTERIRAICFSPDGRLLATKAGESKRDSGILLWRTDTWELLGAITFKPGGYLYSGLAFSPADPILATSASGDKLVQLWRVEPETVLAASPSVKSVYYKNAKIALVGDSGVGKSGLALALTGKGFVPTESTHGRKITMLKRRRAKLPQNRSEIRELILWDLAGQPGYRLIHQLHLEDVSVAVILFDSRSELDPFAGVRYWNRVILHAAKTNRDISHSISRLLVAARIDRGGLAVGLHRIAAAVDELQLDGFVATSAKEGTGIPELRDKIEAAIDWAGIPSVTSNLLFQSIKVFLTKEKRAGRILATIDELLRSYKRVMRNLEALPDLRRSFNTCLRRLQSLGLVRRFSFGDLVLLQPEILDAYASSIIFAAKEEPDGMGSIQEEAVRTCKFPIPQDCRLGDKEQEKLLLLATTEDLLAHEIAFREATDNGQLLIFPSQLTRENPELPDPPGKEVVYQFEGPILNIYATLIVRLAHSNIFQPKEMWKNAVVFGPRVGGGCGVYLTEIDEGRGTMTLFYTAETIPELRQQFDDYIQSHLHRRALPNSVVRSRVLVCPDPGCKTPINSEAIEKRLARGLKSISCVVCDAVIPLNAVRPPIAANRAITREIDSAAARHRMVDTALVSASAEMQTRSFHAWAGSDQTTIALVFTDVVGSTALGNELGDEKMGDIRRLHFSQARKLIANHGGYEIKTIGDSFMVAFRTSKRALDFAIELFCETGHKDIQVRAGIHVGPIRVEEEDAFGNMVNYTARVVGQSKGAEIWVSARAHTDILSEKAKAHQKISWNQHADCELKGFGQKQTLWSMVPC